MLLCDLPNYAVATADHAIKYGMDNVAIDQDQVVIASEDTGAFAAEEIAEQQRMLLLLLDMEV